MFSSAIKYIKNCPDKGISPDWITIVLKVNRPRMDILSQIKLVNTLMGFIHLFAFLKEHMFYI